MHDVLIVGGGGAGLTASMLLAQLGVDSLLVSSLPTTSVLPKAHVLNQHTMEIFAHLGIADTVYDRGTPPEQMRYAGWYAGLAGSDADHGRCLGLVEAWGCGGRSPAWSSAGPCLSTNLPQIRLEPILKARAEELAPGRIRFNQELIALSQDCDGVTATIVDRGTGQSSEIRARYLLACDGGRTVGKLLGVRMEGLRDLARIATVHLSADLSAWAQDPEVLIRWLILPQTGAGATMVPMGPDRWGPDSEEWVVHLNYAADDPRGLDDDQVIADLRAALGLPDHPIDVHLVTRWSIEGVVADRFRDGRVFLLGDAAHRHPPTGGLGLNSAIQDAANLAWKLAAVLRGHAGPRLLDTYEPERKPVTTRNVQRSIENALNHIVTAEATGVSPENSPQANWESVRRLWSGLDEDAEFAATIRRAIAGQSMEFDEHNIEYGYTYDSAAIVPDGTPEPANPDPVRIYQPAARPGHPLPHAWLEDRTGRRLSVHDLVRPGRFLLIAGEDGHDWCTAVTKLADTWPLDAVRIGHLDGDFLDPRSTWVRHRGHSGQGAVLVRPDRFVAWRAQASDLATERLADVLRLILRADEMRLAGRDPAACRDRSQRELVLGEGGSPTIPCRSVFLSTGRCSRGFGRRWLPRTAASRGVLSARRGLRRPATPQRLASDGGVGACASVGDQGRVAVLDSVAPGVMLPVGLGQIVGVDDVQPGAAAGDDDGRRRAAYRRSVVTAVVAMVDAATAPAKRETGPAA